MRLVFNFLSRKGRTRLESPLFALSFYPSERTWRPIYECERTLRVRHKVDSYLARSQKSFRKKVSERENDRALRVAVWPFRGTKNEKRGFIRPKTLKLLFLPLLCSRTTHVAKYTSTFKHNFIFSHLNIWCRAFCMNLHFCIRNFILHWDFFHRGYFTSHSITLHKEMDNVCTGTNSFSFSY